MFRVPSVDYAAALGHPEARLFDLRSPAEYARDAAPGARNTPLLNDLEREVVGLLYRQRSPERAFREGVDFVRERLADLIDAILGVAAPSREESHALYEQLAVGLREATPAQLEPLPASLDGVEEPLVLHCWRGGLRSRAVVVLLRALGFAQVYHLSGGYKDYRRWVGSQLARFAPPLPLIVLRGPTGTGKTALLSELERRQRGSTIDLEGLANHRSSVLGDIGKQPVGQARFEGLLAHRLLALGPPPWFVEGESRKVGDVVIPVRLFEAMERGVQVRVDGTLEARIRRLEADYLISQDAHQELLDRLPFLEKRLGGKWVGKLQELLESGRSDEVARILLERYYDVRYGRSDRDRAWTAELDADSPKLPTQLLELRTHQATCAASSE